MEFFANTFIKKSFECLNKTQISQSFFYLSNSFLHLKMITLNASYAQMINRTEVCVDSLVKINLRCKCTNSKLHKQKK